MKAEVLISTVVIRGVGVALLSSAMLVGAPVDFDREIRPILANNCFECHGPDEQSREAKLRIDTREGLFGPREDGPLLVPGKPGESEIFLRLVEPHPEDRMPPPEAHRHPTPDQIELIKRWIAEGADYAEHWAFIRPQAAALPTVSDPAWCLTPLDHHVLAKLDALGLKPQPEASPGTLARRLSLSLTGLPPTPRELDDFAAAFAQDRQGAVSTWVDRLLASPRFGEHMAWTWMDASRYADTNGYQADGPRQMWRWRDWLIAALNRNLPFDQLTAQMIAGDLLPPMAHQVWETGGVLRDARAGDQLLATGFLRNHRYDTGSGTIPAESKFENAADRMETVGTVWLGLTLHCARCHDHKFDPLPAKDYYRMLAFFDKVPELGSAIKDASHPYIFAPDATQRQELEKHDQVVAGAERARTEAESAISAAQAAWERDLVAGTNAGTRVTRGLLHRFAASTATATANLTPLRGSPLAVDAPAGMGWHFDGGTALQASAEVLAACAGAKAWTLSFWVRRDSAGDCAIFSAVDKPDQYRPGIEAEFVGGKLLLRHVARWVNSYIEFTSRDPFPVGEWRHVALLSDGRMQGVGYRAALDGDETAMICTHEVTNDSADAAPKAPLVLGASPFLPDFKGALADLRVYERRLDAGEVAFLAEQRSIATLAAVPEFSRSPLERRFLREHFLDSAAPGNLRELQSAVNTAASARTGFIKSLPPAMVMQEASGRQTHLRLRGAYDQLGEPVEPGVPSILPPLPADEPANRASLARWLMSPANPLTARVTVNRIWQQLYGRGFVDTPENFGTQSPRPEHAALLDWLAIEYERLGWDTKALLKLIVTSATFRQSSAAPAESWSRDPDNRLLARGPRHRLPIAIVRDSALAISGLLERSIGGPSVLLEPLIGQNDRVVEIEAELNTRRRTLYTFWKRNAPHAMLAVFDTADRNQCSVRVHHTNTPLQALVGLNEPGLAAAAHAFGQRMAAVPDNASERVAWGFRAVTGERPGTEEHARLVEALAVYEQHFRENPGAAGQLGGPDIAPWTVLGNLLLNLDRTLSLE